MTIPIGTVSPTRNTRTPQQIREEQRAQAERMQQARTSSPGTSALVASAGKPVIASARVPAVAAPAQVPADTRSFHERYLDEVSPQTFPGRLIKFDQEAGRFFTADDEEEISPDKPFVALLDETLIGWIKFSGEEGVPPERCQGLLYSGFVMPPLESMPDRDQAQWPLGLSGEPEDPWKHQMCIVLEDRSNDHELFTFVVVVTHEEERGGAGCCATTTGCASRIRMITRSSG
jgi:hypothetical protein